MTGGGSQQVLCITSAKFIDDTEFDSIDIGDITPPSPMNTDSTDEQQRRSVARRALRIARELFTQW
jgi:hypothetical protein